MTFFVGEKYTAGYDELSSSVSGSATLRVVDEFVQGYLAVSDRTPVLAQFAMLVHGV